MSRPRTGFPGRTSRLSRRATRAGRRRGHGGRRRRGRRRRRPPGRAPAAPPEAPRPPPPPAAQAPAENPSRSSPAGGAALPAPGVDLAAVLGPVRSQNAFEETVERLLAVIKLGVVGPGERFPAERELAALLGVSRITLREAIGDLRDAGYVESRRGRFGGTFVTYTPPAPSTPSCAGSRPRMPTRSTMRSPSGWRWKPGQPRSWPGAQIWPGPPGPPGPPRPPGRPGRRHRQAARPRAGRGAGP